MVSHFSVFFAILVLFSSCLGPKKGAKSSKTLFLNLSAEPPTLHPINASDAYQTQIETYIVESLLDRDPETYKWRPGLAETYRYLIKKEGWVEASLDELETAKEIAYEFVLREGVKWHDGKPLTVEDVKFSFDAIFDKKFQAAHLRSYLSGISKVEIIDSKTIRFFAKDNKYNNFDVVAGGIIKILPRHIYNVPKEDQKKLNKKLIGTGPYIFSQYDKGKFIILEKNPNWWGKNLGQFKGTNNFERIFFRMITDKTVALESLRKGKIDFQGLNGEEYLKKTVGKSWESKIKKIKTTNSAPKGYSYIGWNLNHSILKDKDVRRALAHLINRKFMNSKFLYDLSFLSEGPIHPLSMYSNKSVKTPRFDPKEALKILRSRGWRDTDGDQILDKKIKGKKTPLRITILEPLKDFEKYLTVFKEDARKAGVDIQIKIVEWNTFMKLIDERKYEAARLAWGGGGVHWNPRQIWHSSSAKGGSNFVGFKNKVVDDLIDQSLYIFSEEKRAINLRKVHQLIVDQHPYAFLFTSKFVMYAHGKDIIKSKDTLKYSVGVNHWSK